MALNFLFCADVLRPLDLVPLTDFTSKYHPAYGSNDRAMQSVAWLTRSSANADKPGRRQKYTIYNRLGRCAAELLCIYDCHNGGRPTSWILYFRNFCEKLKFAHISSS